MEYNVNRYLNLLTAENKKHNLVSRRNFDEENLKHVEDSQIILQFEDLNNKRIVDIGSGAGFPALVLAIRSPESHFTLVESDLKKKNFLSKVVEELDLPNVEVVRERAELLGHHNFYRNKFNICTSRAVAQINVMLEYGLPLLVLGGEMWLWKGRNYPQEIEDAQNALNLLGGKLDSIHQYTLMGEKDRAIIIIKKVGHTPQKYPRRVGIPSKRPL